MRKSYLLLAGAGAVLLAACSGDNKTSINDDLKKDLELASSSDGITLANSSATAGQQVVSAIERTTPPVRQPTPSNRVRKHKPAPKSPPQVVRAEAPATVAETELQPVDPAPVDPTPVSPRPQPVAVSYPSGPSSGGGDGRVSSGGSTAGVVIGSILGAVIRGGTVGDVDHCDPRTDGRQRRGGISINNRIPFPLPGRVGGTSRSSGPSIGGIPIGRIPRF
ncbi:MAG TPA: hypothetical protein VK494_05460 [Gemmatimonadaceae bacterium]|jgi:hypothetical protein|nr:hypothetical protein [Gemmatimonadaceae bacterium]